MRTFITDLTTFLAKENTEAISELEKTDKVFILCSKGDMIPANFLMTLTSLKCMIEMKEKAENMFFTLGFLCASIAGDINFISCDPNSDFAKLNGYEIANGKNKVKISFYRNFKNFSKSRPKTVTQTKRRKTDTSQKENASKEKVNPKFLTILEGLDTDELKLIENAQEIQNAVEKSMDNDMTFGMQLQLRVGKDRSEAIKKALADKYFELKTILKNKK